MSARIQERRGRWASTRTRWTQRKRAREIKLRLNPLRKSLPWVSRTIRGASSRVVLPAPSKPDGHGTVCLTYTDECSGLVVEACTDGSTRMRVEGTCGVPGNVAGEEVSRTVTSSGHVVRFLVGGGAEILMSDGNVMRWDLGSQHVDESSGQNSSAATKRRKKRRHPEPWRTKRRFQVGSSLETSGTRTRTVPRPRAVVGPSRPRATAR